MTVERHKHTLEMWHLLIGLMREALDGTHDFALYGELAASKELRARFQVVALSTSKAVLDCAVSGLYVQGLALTRHLFETWQRLVYVDLNPGSAFSWLSHNGKKPTPPGQNAIVSKLRASSRDYGNRVGFVEERIKECDLMAHPSHAILASHDTEIEGFLKIAPAYDANFALQLVSNAALATDLIVQELPKSLEVTEDWQHRREAISIALHEDIRKSFARQQEA